MSNASNDGAARAFTRRIEHPRLVSRTDAAYYCGVSLQTFSNWVTAGILPPALPGTARWDLRAIDIRLDTLSNISPMNEHSPLDEWRNKRARRLEGTS